MILAIPPLYTPFYFVKLVYIQISVKSKSFSSASSLDTKKSRRPFRTSGDFLPFGELFRSSETDLSEVLGIGIEWVAFVGKDKDFYLF